LAIVIAVLGVIGTLVEVDSVDGFGSDSGFMEIEVTEPTEVIEIDGPRTARSCSRLVGRSLARMLRAQARGAVVEDLLNDRSPFPVASFEFGTTVRIYANGRIQRTLVRGEVERAISLARREATSRCRNEYGPHSD
jgi:hypothetical protein